MQLQRNIKYHSDVDTQFIQEFRTFPDGELLFQCIQCGTCSGMCPNSIYMDYSPRKIMALIREGLKSDAISSTTVWLCASCYACTVACPQGIKITEIMYHLKRVAIREKSYPGHLPVPILAGEFYKMVRRRGRINELWLAAKLMLLSNPMGLFKSLGLGFRLLKHKRIPLFHAGVSGKTKTRLQSVLNNRPFQ